MDVAPSDMDLLAAWRAGDRKAGSTLFNRHFDRLYRFFSHKVPDEEVQDLLQQTFLGCVESRDRFREDSSVTTFLFSIARRKLVDHWRAKKKNERLDFGVSTLQDLDPSPSSLLRRNQDERLLLEALRGLPVDLQIALELHYWEEMPGPALAEVLAIPEGTVRSRLRRARELLQKRLGQLAVSGEKVPPTLDDLDRWARSLREAIGQ